MRWKQKHPGDKTNQFPMGDWDIQTHFHGKDSLGDSGSLDSDENMDWNLE
jgi:hypothetical protein